MTEAKKEHYKSLDGIRGLSAIGIIMMHVQSNVSYKLNGFIADRLIPSFTDFTYLFMIISAFSLCCGYYEDFQNETVSLEKFYKRRYQRIWPFFAFLCTIDFILEPSIKTLYQYLADISLAFGFIPDNNIEVVGVGWFLGTIFVFYMVFPFLCFWLKTKRRAWVAFATTVILHLLSDIYFKGAQGRENFIYSSMFFMAGGLVFLYREEINELMEKRSRWVIYLLLVFLLVLYYTVLYMSDYMSLTIFSVMCICCLRHSNGGILQNRPCLWISSMSMEIYLCHMLAFRSIEKVHLLSLFGNGWASYLVTVLMTLFGACLA